MPEASGKVLDYRPHPDQETTLSCVHAQTLWVVNYVCQIAWITTEDLEVDSQQGEEGPESSKEEEVERLGHVHLILHHLDRSPETLVLAFS